VELETAQILRVAVSGDRPTKAANARTLQMWSLRVFSLKPRTLMSSIMRARSALTGRSEGWEVIGGSSLKPKVVGPSMLGIGCPGRHALSLTPAENARTVTRAPSREVNVTGAAISVHLDAGTLR